MRAAVCILAVFALAPTVAVGLPTVTIYTDEEIYRSGDTIEVSLSVGSPGDAMIVDVYVALFMPDGSLLLIDQAGGLTGSITPWIEGAYIPAGFELARTAFFWFSVPSGVEGDFEFAAALAWPGTLDFAGGISYAPFSIEDSGPGTDITMLSIPAGSFLMGSPSGESGRDSDEGPQRTVNISAFQMSETEITQKQWEDIMGWNESQFSGDDHPVEKVTWFDCVSFCNRLSEADGYSQYYTMSDMEYNGDFITSAQVSCNFEANGYRLPTEAEWEYACRAGTTTRFYTGDSDSDLGRAGWYSGNSGSTTHTVGEKEANAWGLYDMSGNVWEWCWDWYSSGYYGARPDPDSDPTGASSGSTRILRGGSWQNDAGLCRSASRSLDDPGTRYRRVGFRLVRSVN